MGFVGPEPECAGVRPLEVGTRKSVRTPRSGIAKESTDCGRERDLFEQSHGELRPRMAVFQRALGARLGRCLQVAM